MKINKRDLVLEYHESENRFPIPCGHDHWKDTEVQRIYVLRWKADKNPFSNEDDSKTRDIGYVSFQMENTAISHVYMKPKYRGTGLGEYMYTKVAQQEGYLTSYQEYASVMAQKVWKKLIKKHPSRKFWDGGKVYRIYKK